MIKLNGNNKLIYIEKVKSVFLLLFIVVPSLTYGQVVLTNPGLPEKETIIYIQDTDGERETVKYVLEQKKNNNKSWIEYRFYSNAMDVFIKLNPENLTTYYSEVWERRDDSFTHRINEVLSNSKEVMEDELLITDMDGFVFGLRGFPWGETASAKIIFLNGSGGFSLELKIKGKETIYIADQKYECWKVQLGMKGILGAVFPKSYFWYSVESPHYLVRSEVAGMPGSSKIILEIQSYTAN